jgi:Ca2+-binding EF-hand superfamily protein
MKPFCDFNKGNGTISLEELKQVLKNLGNNATEEEVQKMVRLSFLV